MAGRRVENRFGEEQRTRGLGARLHDVVIKPLRVDDAAIGDGEDQRGARGRFRVELQFRVFQRGQSRDDSES